MNVTVLDRFRHVRDSILNVGRDHNSWLTKIYNPTIQPLHQEEKEDVHVGLAKMCCFMLALSITYSPENTMAGNSES